MSRKSAAAESLRAIESFGRIQPPADLTPAQRELWIAVVATKPPEWFAKDTAPLLTEYVRAVETCNLLAKPVADTLARGDPHEIKLILHVRGLEAGRAASLATKLRLTQQSQYTAHTAATANRRAKTERKPWQIEAGEKAA